METVLFLSAIVGVGVVIIWVIKNDAQSNPGLSKTNGHMNRKR